MTKMLSTNYANITARSLELYKSYCTECQRKKKRPTVTGVVVRPLLTSDFNSRGQVDLIDMQSMPHPGNKWIMVYQDHLTTFCVIRAIVCKRATEVTLHLVDIFLLLGAPVVLRSDNGSEFTANEITEVQGLWPGLKLVRDKTRHPQSQCSVERANGDIKDRPTAWVGDNNTTDRTLGVKFVQFHKNSAHNAGIQRSSYEAMFGCKVKVGLTSTSLPAEVIGILHREEDVLALVAPNQISDNRESSQQPTPTPPDTPISMQPATQAPTLSDTLPATQPDTQPDALPATQPDTQPA